MAMIVSYYPGGFQAGAPAQNRREQYDGAAVTFTAWDTAGNVTTTRALTAAEVAFLAGQDQATTATANAGTVLSHAQTALAANATFLALGSPTNAQIVAQVQRLTRECSGLIRILLGQLADVSDT